MSPTRPKKTRHTAKMAKIKAARDKIMATKTGEKGLLIVHTGAGKGKIIRRVSAWCLRCIGHGMPVGRGAVHQGRLGHRRAPPARAPFRRTVTLHTMGEGFTWETQDRARDIAAAAGRLGNAPRN